MLYRAPWGCRSSSHSSLIHYSEHAALLNRNVLLNALSCRGSSKCQRSLCRAHTSGHCPLSLRRRAEKDLSVRHTSAELHQQIKWRAISLKVDVSMAASQRRNVLRLFVRLSTVPPVNSKIVSSGHYGDTSRAHFCSRMAGEEPPHDAHR